MEEKYKVLEKIVTKCIKYAAGEKGIPISPHGQSICTQQVVKNLVGHLMLQSSPFYTFVLEDKGFKLQCIIKDPANSLTNWIKAHNKKVVIRKGLIVVERFQFLNQNDKLFVNLVVCGSDIEIVEEDIICLGEDKKNRTWKQRFCVQHVSSAFIADGVRPTCFVLILFPDAEGQKLSEVWLMFKGDQITWKNLLIPNREYVMVLPSFVPTNYFSRHQRPLSCFLGDQTKKLFEDVLHHPPLFPALNVVAVPQNVSLYLQSSSSLSFSTPPRESVLWQSLSQAEASKGRILSIYGEIKSVRYDMAVSMGGCSLCKNDKHKPKNQSDVLAMDQLWVDPWTQPLTLPEDEYELGLQLPELQRSDSFIFESFTPENLVQKVVIECFETGDYVSIYIKNWRHYWRPMALTPGQILCAKFVNRRYSEQGSLYYTSCPLSSFQILYDLERKSGTDRTEPWGQYGFPDVDTLIFKKSWGILEMEELFKVSISAICGNCESLFLSGRCTLTTCKSTRGHIVQATAVVHVYGTKGQITIIMKDDNVRIYLGIDKPTWDIFCVATGIYELLYLQGNQDHDFDNIVQSFFAIYCKVLRPRQRFYISVRRLREADTTPLYYCSQLEPVTTDGVSSQLSTKLFSELCSKSMK